MRVILNNSHYQLFFDNMTTLLFAHMLKLKGDRAVVLAAVKQDGYSLKNASDDLRADKEVVLAAVRQNGYSLKN